MKRRRTTIRNALLAGVAAVALSAVAPEASVAQGKPGWFGSIEGRYLNSFGDATDAGVSGYDFYTYGEFSESLDLDLDDGFGGKLLLGYLFPARSPQWDVAAAVSGGVLDGDDLSFSGSYFYSSALSFDVDVEAEAEMDYFVIDLEAGYNVGLGNPGHVRAFGGLRFARFDQDAHFDFGFDFSSYSGDIEAERDVDYWGVGPRVGVSGDFPLGDSNFSVVGGAAAAVLFGERETTDSLVVDFISSDPSSYSESEDDFQIVGNVEADLGVSYAVANNAGMNIEIAAGWRVETWFGVNNTDWNLVGPVPEIGEVGDNDGDQLMHGPFLRITITPGGAQKTAAKPRGGAAASRMAPTRVSQAPPLARVPKPKTEVVEPAPPREPPRTVVPASTGLDTETRLIKLKALYDQGLISDRDYYEKRRQLSPGMSAAKDDSKAAAVQVGPEKKPGEPEPSVKPDDEMVKIVFATPGTRGGEADRGSREYIMWVQRSLNQILGTDLDVDGIMGRQTRGAVRSFQTEAGIGVDGIAGPRTEDALIKAGASPPRPG